MLTLFSLSRSFGHFLTISDYFKRFPKTTENYRKFPETTEDVRSLPKISEEKSENFAVFTGERYIFSVQTRFFHQIFSPKALQTLNRIFSGNSKHQKNGRLTATTKNYG